MGGCSRRHRWGTRILLPAGALWVIAGGLSEPLGLPELSTWPWNQAWYVFSSDDGWDYRLRLEGELADGRREAIDPGRWFRVRSTETGGRLQEMPRDRETMARLADHLCARVNAGAPPERRITRVSIVERAWPRARGHRLRDDEVPDRGAVRRVWIDGRRCAEAPP